MTRKNNPKLDEAKKLLGNSFAGCKVSAVRFGEQQPSLLISYSGSAKIECDRDNTQIEFVRLKSSSKAALADYARMTVDDSAGAHKILLFERLSADAQASCRSFKLNYIDAAGNAWISIPGYHVDRQGFKASRIHPSVTGSRNVFSDKSTLILRLLLSGERMGVREISRTLSKSGFYVSPGYVTKVLQALNDVRYVKAQDGLCLLSNRRELIEDWASDYKRRNRPQKTGLYLPAREIGEAIGKVGAVIGEEALLTSHAGASLVDPFAVFDSIEVMTKAPEATIAALLGIGAKPAERGANIQVVLPRYKVAAFYGARLVSGIMVASDLQLYLDLLCQPIRGLEAAEHLYYRFIAPLIEDGNNGDE
jgi:hypothetical protein